MMILNQVWPFLPAQGPEWTEGHRHRLRRAALRQGCTLLWSEEG